MVFGLSIPVVFVVVVAVVSFFVVVVVVIVLYETDVSIGWTFIVFQTMHKELNPTVAKPKLKSKDSFKSRANFGEVEHLEYPMNIPMIRLIAKKIGFLKRIASHFCVLSILDYVKPSLICGSRKILSLSLS